MTDHITLPRAVGEQLRLSIACYDKFLTTDDVLALAALAAALAEPEKKPEPVAWMVTTTDERHFIFRMVKPVVSEGETLTPLFTYPPAAPPEPDAKREPATYEQVKAAHAADCYAEGIYRWHDYRVGWQAAEWFHSITKENGK